MEQKSLIDIMKCKNCRWWKNGLCLDTNINIGEGGTCGLWESNNKEIETVRTHEITQEEMKRAYHLIIQVMKKYCDLEEEQYNIVALWILGTYFHKQFTTYPYLFFNAMKGSGKSRLLRLISHLCWNGDLLTNLSEAVVFRTASTSTFCIDEFESVEGKEKATLRELLNASYKKGMCVKRAKKIKGDEGEGYEIEKFELYCPIAMANITGMDNVLADRCLSLVLDKSNSSYITKLIELYEQEPQIQEIKRMFSVGSVCMMVLESIEKEWNNYVMTNIHNIHNIHSSNINNSNTPSIILHTQPTSKYLEFFEQVNSTEIDGRHLELFMPLFIIAKFIGEDILMKTLESAKKIVNEKKGNDSLESRDVSFLEFIAGKNHLEDMVSITLLTNEFRSFLDEDPKSMETINNEWLGRALKRHKLVVDKKRVSRGIMVRIDIEKARKKLIILKPSPKYTGEDRRKQSIPVIEDRRKQ